ncbi:hypothetical protein [Nonomuraea endophytica]|uniref:Uncharacterized protein n=1 Tax=Nonomuraea endophytica TaxID=714136 RepID=A0A7W8AAI2_9ACTN|nr:hypothetical protein [Nonomuraea endophytica]MBB5082636.1 hypothetical protein [Nonomuraea endophytica]
MSGLLVGAVFGAVFVVVNAQEPLGGPVVTVLRVLACLAAASVVAMWFVAVRRERPAREQAPRPSMFGKGYLAVVAAEVVLLFGGLRVLAALGVPAQANVAWVAFVVGVHFVALAPVWKDWAIAVPGAVLTVLGVAGLVMAATGGLAWVPFVSGVLSGAVLLAGSVTFGWKAIRSAPAGVPVRA